MHGSTEIAPRIRAFVSYSHEDFALARDVSDVLEGEHIAADWDRNIQPGTAFTDAIKSRILHSHVFIPLITEKSQRRPWIHQETGYAMALNVPVLPLVIGAVEEFTPAMIAQLKAIALDSVADLKALQIGTILRQLVQPVMTAPPGLMEIAYWPEVRTELLGKYALRVLELAAEAKCRPTLRQRGYWSSFCIPDADEHADVWREREAPTVRSEYYHHLQRLERQALERCAREGGCRLILDLAGYRQRNEAIAPSAQAVRLRTLRAFLETCPETEVVSVKRPRSGNLTILGDWFSAESIVPRAGKGYFQTIFNWHAPTTFRKVAAFDREFEDAARIAGPLGTGTDAVIRLIDAELAKLPSDDSPPDDPSAARK